MWKRKEYPHYTIACRNSYISNNFLVKVNMCISCVFSFSQMGCCALWPNILCLTFYTLSEACTVCSFPEHCKAWNWFEFNRMSTPGKWVNTHMNAPVQQNAKSSIFYRDGHTCWSSSSSVYEKKGYEKLQYGVAC